MKNPAGQHKEILNARTHDDEQDTDQALTTETRSDSPEQRGN